LQRALSLIEKANSEPTAPQFRALATTDADEIAAKWKAVEARRGLVTLFPDRFEGKPIPFKPLDKDVATSLLDTSLKTYIGEKDRELYEKWDTARRHLNELEIFAFAYVYDFADRKLLAAAACGRMVRSNAYFKELIEVLRVKFGYAQSWQIIPQAVTMMEREYGAGCENLYSQKQ
jgi:hypothetical protein